MVLGSSRRRVIPTAIQESSSDVDSQCEHDTSALADDGDEEDCLEPWTEWIKRTTHSVESQLDKLKIESWLHQARRRKWAWAARVACMPDDRWAKKLIIWNPQLHFEGLVARYGRQQARPRVRWSDEICSFVQNVVQTDRPWTEFAEDAKRWSGLADAFVGDAWRRPSCT